MARQLSTLMAMTVSRLRVMACAGPPARLSRRPGLASRLLQATGATTIPAAAGANPVTAARSGL
jgi:hypothetical protein